MIITLDSGGGNEVVLTKIVSWDEVKSTQAPIQSELAVPIGSTVYTSSSKIKPTRFEIRARLTPAQKITLYALQAEHEWQPMDDDGSLIDHVWIEHVDPKWRVVEDTTSPWLTTIGLIASTT